MTESDAAQRTGRPAPKVDPFEPPGELRNLVRPSGGAPRSMAAPICEKRPAILPTAGDGSGVNWCVHSGCWVPAARLVPYAPESPMLLRAARKAQHASTSSSRTS